MNTGGWAKVPGPLDDFRLAMSNNDPGAKHAWITPTNETRARTAVTLGKRHGGPALENQQTA